MRVFGEELTSLSELYKTPYKYNVFIEVHHDEEVYLRQLFSDPPSFYIMMWERSETPKPICSDCKNSSM